MAPVGPTAAGTTKGSNEDTNGKGSVYGNHEDVCIETIVGHCMRQSLEIDSHFPIWVDMDKYLWSIY